MPAPEFYPNVWVTTTEYAQANTTTLKKLVAAIYKTAAWANTHKSESGAILIKYSKLEPGMVSAMARSDYATSMNPKLLQPLIDVGVKFGMLPAPVAGSNPDRAGLSLNRKPWLARGR